jgi:hypothetical protein
MEVYDNNYRGPVYIERRTNGLGTAGFVLSLITFIFGWVPVFGWIMWVLGLVFSFIGMFRRPRGLAIAGFIISLIDVILILFLFAVIAAALGIAGASTALYTML